MSVKDTKRKTATDMEALRALKDEDIDLSDIPELGPDFWKNAKLRMPTNKDRISIFLDHDLLEWLKAQGRGYQTRINAILRSWMEAQLKGKRA